MLWCAFLKFRPTTYTGHVILEISTTETTYVGDLTDIVEVHYIIIEWSTVFKHSCTLTTTKWHFVLSFYKWSFKWMQFAVQTLLCFIYTLYMHANIPCMQPGRY